ncbi:16S rRNA (adenine(1518)-N(6)/adenine(1519)-N(6))-dimethyltransferase, partial [bacterium]
AIVSNMPYYITAPLLDRFTAQRAKVERLVLMMQREVGDRIAAPAGKSERGSLSVSLQRLFTIERLIDVPPEAFAPPPKVRSVVLVLRPRDIVADPDFERLVRAGFTHPRKTLANNLSAVYPRETILAVAEKEGFEPTIRPHQLTEAQWLTLQNALKS